MKLSVVSLAVCSMLACTSVLAQTASSTFGSTGPYTYGSIGGANVGQAFTLGSDATLDSWTFTTQLAPNHVSLAIYSFDVFRVTATGPETTAYFTQTLSGTPSMFAPGSHQMTFAPTGGLNLTAGSYLVSVSHNEASTSYAFRQPFMITSEPTPAVTSPAGLTFTEGLAWARGQGTAWVANTGFDSSTGITTNNRLQYSATFSSVQAVTAVPEPSTYALMLAGLGVVGWSARRRQRKAQAAA